MREETVFESEQLKNDDEIYIDLKELFFAYLQRWYMILTAMVIIGGILGAYCKFLVPPAYQADATLYITSNDSVVSFSDLQISSALTEDYQNIITSRRVMNKVISNLGMSIKYEELKKMVEITNPSDSHIIKIAVTNQNTDDAVMIANELLNVSVTEIYKIIGSSEPSIIDESGAAYAINVKPSVLKYALIGALLGMILVCGIITILVISDTTLKTEEDIETWLELPVLATVPYNVKKGSKGYGYGRKEAHGDGI